MLAKDSCEMTTYAETKSTCNVVKAVEKFLTVGLMCFFPYTDRRLIVDTVLHCICWGAEILSFIKFILFAKLI